MALKTPWSRDETVLETLTVFIQFSVKGHGLEESHLNLWKPKSIMCINKNGIKELGEKMEGFMELETCSLPI